MSMSGDKREVYVTMTDAGAQALQAANEVLLERVQVVVEQLDAREREDLVMLLQKLVLF